MPSFLVVTASLDIQNIIPWSFELPKIKDPDQDIVAVRVDLYGASSFVYFKDSKLIIDDIRVKATKPLVESFYVIAITLDDSKVTV